MTDPCPRAPQQSEVVLNQLMLIGDANPHGNVHGGVLMKMMDEAGAICAMRHARANCVTVAVDSMEFHSPVHVGELVRCRAGVTWVGRTSIEVEIHMDAEDAVQGRLTHTNSAFLVYVAIDQAGKPVAVPPLRLETEAERRAWEQAVARRESRLLHRAAVTGPVTGPV
jgi:uncharacterized protein (TIGR00369 family)